MKLNKTDLLKRALVYLEEELKDIGGCDHQINICCCDLIDLIEKIQKIIKKESQ